MRSSDVTDRISKLILQDILSGEIDAGDHVNVITLAENYGVSRTPVRDALKVLELKSIVERKPNRGYFVAQQIPENVHTWARTHLEAKTDEYQQLANDWLTDSIAEEVTEQFIRERYDWTKSKATAMLSRAQREGWAERKPGYGWRFLPVAKTPEAFSEIYRFRIAIEPAALLEPTFKLNRKVISNLRDTQNRILDAEMGTLSDETLLSYGPSFHEELIKLSGNPYFFSALQQVNRMRKLMEYKAEINRERLVVQCNEHLEILDMLEQGSLIDASFKLRQHLTSALERKSYRTRNWLAAQAVQGQADKS